MRRGDGVLIGQNGVQYGLQRGPAKPLVAAVPQPSRAFGLDDSDEEDIGTQVARQAERKSYDSIQAARTQPKQQEKIDRKSRYIAQLKEQAEQRKREEDIRYERVLLKERKAEDHLFEGKEKFVTAAYRKKLEEDKKWAEEQQKKDEEDERNAARKAGHMANFYSNLLTKNVAMGTAKPPAPSLAASAASTSATGAGEETGSGLAALAPPPKPAAAPVLDRYEQLRLAAERARLAQPITADGGTAVPQGSATDAAPDLTSPAEQLQPLAPSSPSSQPGGEAGAEQQGGAADIAKQQAAVLAGKRRNDDGAVMSAKERYLARKKQHT
ncbi:hypothetical protein QJQ45_011545 [Haematococcus lacustris]|nr:hypothetical protein QJQ45_011545 [Haematococcus lacustris]